jgi:sec-independent protein translocase protein TatA
MMALDNPLHIAFLLVVLLFVFGAKRLPEMGRSLGAGLRGFKESISGETPPTAVGSPEAGGPGAHMTAASVDTTATSQTVKSETTPPAAEPAVEPPGLTAAA